MAKEMLINVSEGEECRIALLDDGKLEELYMERTSSTSHVGNIYKGKVTNVEASIQAAFVDFGLGRNGFLHISDLMPTYFGRKGEDIQESVGKKMARRDRPPIQRCLRRGDEIIVQIIKEGIGTKGPTLSTYLSIPGRILVMMPGMGKMGVSKKIEDEEERRRLRTILDSLKPPKGVGFIIRTAGIGKSKLEIQRDLTYLSRLWMQIEKQRESGSGPMELYTEGDLVARTVRDVFSGEVDRLIVDNADVAKRVKEVIKITSPRTRNKLEVYDEPIPLFHKYGIEKDIELMYSRHVPLPSGGSLVIDSTEAIVAIDVNSGKFRDHSDAEMTAFKTDMEAADEIPRQLKLRDLGGVIICDFIDLRYERHRRELEERLHENFKKDRAKTKVLRMSQFGIIEITRQRMRPSLKRSIYFDCPHCKGAGLVKTPESMSLDVMRKLAMAAHHEKVARIELSVCPDVAFYLLNKKRATLTRIESESQRRITVKSDAALGLDEMRFDLFDGRDGLIFLDELGLTAQPPHTTQLNTRPAGHKGRGGRDNRGRDQRGGGRHQQQPRNEGRREEELELEDAEDAIEAREERRERSPADDALIASIAPKIVHEDDEVGHEEVGHDEPAHEEADHSDRPPVAAAVPQDAGEDFHDEEEEPEAEEPNVVDIDDGHSELGERPQGEWDRQYNNRGGSGGGGGGGGGGYNNQEGGGRRRRRRGRGGRDRDQQGGGGQGGQQQGDRQGGGQGRNQNQGDRQGGGQRQPLPQKNRGPQQGGQQGGKNRPQPPQRPVAPSANDIGEDYGDEIEEGPGPGNELHPKYPPRAQQGTNRGGQRFGPNRGGQNRGGQNRGGQNFRGGQPNRGGFQQRQGQPQGNPQYRDPQQRDPQHRDQPYRDEPRRDQPPRNQPPRNQPPRDPQFMGPIGAPSTSGAPGGPEAGAFDENGGKRRRRRRGGRRHRRRRERERLAREQAAAQGIPYVPPPARADDDDMVTEFEDQQGVPEGGPGEQPLTDDRAADHASDEADDHGYEPEAEPVNESPARALEPEADSAEADSAEEAEENEEAPEPASKGRAKRKPAAKKKAAPAKKKPAAKAKATKAPAKGRKTTKRTPTKSESKSAASSDEAPVIRTGSADKHLADDEPAEPPPVSRPKRRYDMDAIDDDYD